MAACSSSAAPPADGGNGAAAVGSATTVPPAEASTSVPVASTEPSTATAGSTSEPAPDPEREQRTAAARRLLDRIEADGPGCSAAVAEGEELVFAEARGMASIEEGVENTPATMMDVGSTSKQFTALAVLLLADEGELALDSPLAAYVPELPEWAGLVTLREMMHHRSGIPDYIELLADRIDEPTTVQDALDALLEVETLEFAPGTRFSYSNSNYFLFSLVVEEVTGHPLDAYVAQEVFVPLDLTMIIDPVGAIPDKARSYERVDDAWEPVEVAWTQLGDGAVQATPTELVRWAREYWAPTIGSEAVHAGRFDAAVPAGEFGLDVEYGAGIARTVLDDGTVVLFHDGGWAGFTTSFLVVPDRELAIAVTCNGIATDGPVGGTLGQDLLQLWLA